MESYRDPPGVPWWIRGLGGLGGLLGGSSGDASIGAGAARVLDEWTRTHQPPAPPPPPDSPPPPNPQIGVTELPPPSSNDPAPLPNPTGDLPAPPPGMEPPPPDLPPFGPGEEFEDLDDYLNDGMGPPPLPGGPPPFDPRIDSYHPEDLDAYREREFFPGGYPLEVPLPSPVWPIVRRVARVLVRVPPWFEIFIPHPLGDGELPEGMRPPRVPRTPAPVDAPPARPIPPWDLTPLYEPPPQPLVVGYPQERAPRPDDLPVPELPPLEIPRVDPSFPVPGTIFEPDFPQLEVPQPTPMPIPRTITLPGAPPASSPRTWPFEFPFSFPFPHRTPEPSRWTFPNPFVSPTPSVPLPGAQPMPLPTTTAPPLPFISPTPLPNVPNLPSPFDPFVPLEQPRLTPPQTSQRECRCPKPRKRKKQPSDTIAAVKPFRRRMSRRSLANLR